MMADLRIHEASDDAALIKQEVQKLGDELNKAVLSLNSVIDQLNLRFRKDCTGLFRRLNIVQARTRGLSSELLGLIFQYARGDPTLDDTQRVVFRLGRVCWQWRQAVLSTPQLWSYLYLLITNKNEERALRLLRLYHHNAKNTPLSLSFEFIYKYKPNKNALDLFTATFRQE